jgi:lipopolysaccharide transport system ATP-binding protein
VVVDGKIGALLELGAGFNPEFTGRENVALAAAVMGFSGAETDALYEGIVDFSGVREFIDQPVKTYSSGMYVRLAFAVAAHLDPEILIVDEVLAVGDAEFQKKALGKMKNFSGKEGRTVLFVSHNMEAIQNLCNRSILMSKGCILEDGNTSKIINNYLLKETDNGLVKDNFNGEFDLLINSSKIYSKQYGMIKARLFVNDEASSNFYSGGKCRIEVDFLEEKSISNLVLGLVIKDRLNKPILAVNNKHYAKVLFSVPTQKGTFSIDFDEFPLYGEGRYFCDLYLGNTEYNYDIIYNAFYIDINSSDPLFSGYLLDSSLNQFYFQNIKFSGE